MFVVAYLAQRTILLQVKERESLYFFDVAGVISGHLHLYCLPSCWVPIQTLASIEPVAGPVNQSVDLVLGKGVVGISEFSSFFPLQYTI